MARISISVIQALRNTAKRIENSPDYQWGHMGACNCGFLAQEITSLSKSEIHTRAMQRYGDWNEQLNDYCPASGFHMDDLISELLNFGFDIDDLKHLEKLSDPNVLHQLPLSRRYLRHNNKADVVLYLNAMADRIENQWLEKITIPSPVEGEVVIA